jgi:hypothetical protein
VCQDFRIAPSLTSSMYAIAPVMHRTSTMASKLIPFVFRSVPRAPRHFQRAQWRAFSVSRPARSDSLNVVGATSCPLALNCTAHPAYSTATRPRTMQKSPSSSLPRMRSSSRKSSRGIRPSTRRPPSCRSSTLASASTDSRASAS